MKSFRSVSSFILVYMVMQFVSAVLGVQFLKGKLFYCTDKTKLSERECKGQFFEYNDGNIYSPVIQERRWLRHDFHFDNVFAAMLTLFVITTGEGWPTILLHARDAVHEDQGPEKDRNMEISIYFIIYIVIAPFFFLNIFIAMITVAFQDEEDNAKQYDGLTKSQRTCIQYVINTQPISKFRVPGNASNLRKVVRKIVISNIFENIVTVIVILSAISLTLQYSNQTDNWKNVIMYCNIVFTALFLIEAALRIIGLGVKNYFRVVWNILDFVIVIIGIIEFFLYQLDEHHSFVKFRILRVLRIIKLLKRKKSLAVLLWTFVHSIKALPNVFCLNLLSLYIFAVAGMQLFGNIAIQEDSSITEYNNFHNVGQSLILLFRCVTGEDWHDIMMDCVNGQECVEEEYENCGTDIGAYIFFPAFIFLSSFLMMNLFVAVIVCNFDYFHRDPSELAPCHLEEFAKKWVKYDPNATGYIKIDEFKSLVRNLDPPLGFGRRCPDYQLQQNFLKMNIKIEKVETKNGKAEMKSTTKEDKELADCSILCQHDKDKMGVNDHLRNENEEVKFDQESRKPIQTESKDNDNTQIMKSLKEENFECKDLNNRSGNENIHSDNRPCTKTGKSDSNSLLKVKFLSALFSLTRKALGLYKYDGSISNDADLKKTIHRIFKPEDDKLDSMIPDLPNIIKTQDLLNIIHTQGTGKVCHGLRYYTAIQIWKDKTINKNKVIKRPKRLSKKGVLSSLSETLVGHRKRSSNILSQECSEVINTDKNNTSTHITTINETDIDQGCV